MKKQLLIFAGLAAVLAFSSCKSSSVSSEPSTTTSTTSTITSVSTTSTTSEEPIEYGLPVPATGHYMKDADVIEAEDGDRLLVYTTNAESGEEDNVIAIREGVYSTGNGYLYGEEHVIVTPSASGWDQYIGAPSITKGTFEYNSVDYAYLLAYHGTTSATEVSNSIGLAVTNDPLGTWFKVGSAPVLEYDADVYGESYMGFHAPSLINMSKTSMIRLFYTWADAYGHYSYFVDFDAMNLNSIDLSGYVMVPNNGNLTSGDPETMIPNGDFAYDGVNHDVFMVKDYSPAASQQPRVSTRIELAYIAEDELYTTDQGDGWVSLEVYIFVDTPEGLYERLYSGAIVSDEFGHMLATSPIEVIYNISELEADNPNFLFTQQLATITYTAS
ncbi:MAG TPA: hypothetical protein DCM23_01450 [Firmicutes bacterium]|nr:hypothetical protein [Bacillota bacterium]